MLETQAMASWSRLTGSLAPTVIGDGLREDFALRLEAEDRIRGPIAHLILGVDLAGERGLLARVEARRGGGRLRLLELMAWRMA